MKALKCKTPEACRADREALYEQIQSDKIFGAFTDQEREVIWSEVLATSTDRLIPSLFSFFRDINYLQEPTECIKILIKLLPEETLSSALKQSFSNVNQRINQHIIQ